MRKLLLLCLGLFALAACAPVATLSEGGGGFALEFANPEPDRAEFAAIILGESVGIDDPRCEPGDGEFVGAYACDLGVLEAGAAITPVSVEGERLSCDIYRLPVFKIYPCSVR